MEKETFLELCEKIKENLINIHNTNDQSLYQDNIFLPQANFIEYTNQLIEGSCGRIYTNDLDFVDCFRDVFIACSNIKFHQEELRYYESQIKENKKSLSEDKVYEKLKELLERSYGIALEALDKALNFGKTK
jgi:hypothetical protein